MTKLFLSIVTVTRNNLSGLEKTKDSISQQNFTDFEWIIIDGNSNDGTKDFLPTCHAFSISEPDQGLYDAMNKGITRANGQYLLFLNAGDIFASQNTLNSLFEQAQSDSDFIYGDALEMHEGKDIYKYARPHELAMKGMFTHHQAMIYNRDTLASLRYDLKYKIAADYDFTLRFLEKAKAIQYIPIPLCLFESGGISERNALKGRWEQVKIRHALKQNLWDNLITFSTQSIVYRLRRLSPKIYWHFKRFSLRA